MHARRKHNYDKDQLKKQAELLMNEEARKRKQLSPYLKSLELNQSNLSSADNNLIELLNEPRVKPMTPTEERIQRIKDIIDNQPLIPMVDFDLMNTVTAMEGKINKKIIDIEKLMQQMNVTLHYYASGSSGHTFQAINRTTGEIDFAVKVCAFPKDKFGHMTDDSRPENAELRMINLLTYMVVKYKTPHFVLPLGTFNTVINHFIYSPDNHFIPVIRTKMYDEFIKKYHKHCFDDYVSILLSEWCSEGDFITYVKRNYRKMNLTIWKTMFFHILSALARVHLMHPNFKHNDMKANNILVQSVQEDPHGEYDYMIDQQHFIVPAIGVRLKIWDFDFSCIDGVIENNKINSDWARALFIHKRKNHYSDIHFFFNTLCCPKIFKDFYTKYVPDEIIDFVHRVVPSRVRGIGIQPNEKIYAFVDEQGKSKPVSNLGRLLIDEEITTPYKLIMEDPLFASFRQTQR